MTVASSKVNVEGKNKRQFTTQSEANSTELPFIDLFKFLALSLDVLTASILYLIRGLIAS